MYLPLASSLKSPSSFIQFLCFSNIKDLRLSAYLAARRGATGHDGQQTRHGGLWVTIVATEDYRRRRHGRLAKLEALSEHIDAAHRGDEEREEMRGEEEDRETHRSTWNFSRTLVPGQKPTVCTSSICDGRDSVSRVP